MSEVKRRINHVKLVSPQCHFNKSSIIAFLYDENAYLFNLSSIDYLLPLIDARMFSRNENCNENMYIFGIPFEIDVGKCSFTKNVFTSLCEFFNNDSC